jgi:hypothetical protein
VARIKALWTTPKPGPATSREHRASRRAADLGRSTYVILATRRVDLDGNRQELFSGRRCAEGSHREFIRGSPGILPAAGGGYTGGRRIPVMSILLRSPRLRASLAIGAACLTASTAALAGPAFADPGKNNPSTTINGLHPNAIKHVWLIILENKSYDASFTGLNKNSYLWQTLPQQGVLLKNYFGTSHFSQGNYESMVSGQGPQSDTSSDCDVAATNFSSNDLIEKAGGSLAKNPNYGQADATKGPYAPDGQNGCVYPSHVPTLFNQLDAAHKTWKGYAQDLGDQPGREDGPCGYPGTATNTPDSASVASDPLTGPTQTNNPKAYPGVTSFTGVQAAGKDAAGNPGAKEDGYVAKHFPFPWFHSLIDGTTKPQGGGSDCDANHIANLDSQAQGLYHDLQSEDTTPAFSWITPNNCSDAHDAICKGNNLSGAFNADGAAKAGPETDPRQTTPVNYTGGLYASDLFLKWYVPMIEQSAAFKDGGLIDITFDEANPPFVNSSFNNANDPEYAGQISKPATASTFIQSDAAGQNINGKDVSTEPTGPNTPVTPGGTCTATPCPGPGNAAFIDRKPKAAAAHPGATAPTGTSTISDNAIAATDPGRSVTGAGIPSGSFVGAESNVGPNFPTTNTGSVTTGTFTLVNAAGSPVTTTGPVQGITLGAQSSDPSAKNYDPLLDTTDFTPGGGPTGSVLISPFIKPGTESDGYYNHYSWLRTMEDAFSVTKGKADSTLTPGAGSISGGLDGLGHLGYAAQDGLTPFGPDVFNNPHGDDS